MRRLFALIVLCLTPAHAWADAIDGAWCRNSANLNIAGPALRTPGGRNISGDYDRHGFRYVVPDGEPGSGAKVVMLLVNEDTMELIRSDAAQGASPEIWKRCQPVS